MGKLTEILSLAQERAKAMGLSYAGAVTPAEAQAALQLAPGAKLVDVRTRAELDWVGRVPDAIEIEWSRYPGMARNENFLAQFKQQVDHEALVFFLCRSGARSDQAAKLVTEAGFSGCYNICLLYTSRCV